jgi:hypothetical protein
MRIKMALEAAALTPSGLGVESLRVTARKGVYNLILREPGDVEVSVLMDRLTLLTLGAAVEQALR